MKCLLRMKRRTITVTGMGYGNCRAVETVEKRTACFPTVPTALGKLGKKQLRRVFHSSHSPYYYLLQERGNRMYVARLVQNRMDKKESGA
jgi:hypothetical protein